MRINIGQTTSLFQAGAINQSMNRNYNMNHQDKGKQSGTLMRSDMAVISHQGKASSLLANLKNQKELIQSNKDFLITRALDEEDGSGSAALQEQLEEYKLGSVAAERKLEKIKEVEKMTGQMEPLWRKGLGK